VAAAGPHPGRPAVVLGPVEAMSRRVGLAAAELVLAAGHGAR
jgi:hypothetical protein